MSQCTQACVNSVSNPSAVLDIAFIPHAMMQQNPPELVLALNMQVILI